MNDCCQGSNILIYSCSGGSDVGEIADRTARKLGQEGFGKMTCLAAIGAHLPKFLEAAKGTDKNITIDGCPVACARKNLEHIGIKPLSFILTELGLVKGQTPVSEKIVVEMAEKIISKVTAPGGQGAGTCGCSCC
ncbi:MAG: putative zinc-binding protein [Proteobacteria bacterium]|nr:putative zinc-binding protein [Pseudomonadota bacterium]